MESFVLETSLVATNRDDAKSQDQIEQEVQASVKGKLYESIESRIGLLGRCGFVVDVSYIFSLQIIRDYRFLKAASTAFDEVVREYKSAGWDVSQESIGETSSLRFR